MCRLRHGRRSSRSDLSTVLARYAATTMAGVARTTAIRAPSPAWPATRRGPPGRRRAPGRSRTSRRPRCSPGPGGAGRGR
ncbi:hypothetical protein NKH77_53275 [Streptomyces sp. M19]